MQMCKVGALGCERRIFDSLSKRKRREIVLSVGLDENI